MLPKFYCVTFSESSRWPSFEQRLKMRNLSYEKVDGVSKHTSKCITNNRHLLGTEDAAVACFLSHLRAVQKGYDSGDEYFGIFEDDVIFIEDFEERFQTTFSNLPDNWNVFMLCSYQTSWEGCLWAGKNPGLNNLCLINHMSFGAQG